MGWQKVCTNMIRTLTTKDLPLAQIVAQLSTRGQMESADVVSAVRAIVADVAARGDEAILEYTHKFDSAAVEVLRVTRESINDARRSLRPEFASALARAAANIRQFHQAEKAARGYGDAIDWLVDRGNGSRLGEIVRPVQRVGIMVPGKAAPCPSTVLMCAIPAKVAGVEYVAIASPPRPDGTLAPEILAAAHEAGVDDVYTMGGAQAVAAFAYGSIQVKPVDVIVGPGNIYVTIAKREVFGRVGIDMLAGPSEVLIIADETCNPRFAAIDMVSQAEHGETSAAILVTHVPELAESVMAQALEVLRISPRGAVLRKSLFEYGGIVLTQSLEESIALANLLAPEHLEVMTANPERVAEALVSAGAIFCGNWSPTPLGDYLAGPSHVLPTGGTGRFSSPLSVATYMKRSSVIQYSQGTFAEESNAIQEFARAEGLWAHGESARIRGA